MEIEMCERGSSKRSLKPRKQRRKNSRQGRDNVIKNRENLYQIIVVVFTSIMALVIILTNYTEKLAWAFLIALVLPLRSGRLNFLDFVRNVKWKT